jgi:hypothetical protein
MSDQSRKSEDRHEIDQKIKRRSFLSFSTFIVAGATAYGGWRWLYNSPKEIGGITGNTRVPLRRALNQSELFFRRLFSNNHMVKTYPKSMAAKEVRVNSKIGLKESAFKEQDWILSVIKKTGETLTVEMNDLLKLPKTEIIFDFKCVEGWDQIQHWAGVRFIDFIEHYNLQEFATKKYVGMETPDGKYYVGLDIESAMHPQTILAYEMNNQRLTLDHGAPLRLIIPVKYGIKNLKRIGTINFSDERPRDYWAERGYDYYSGL